MLKDLILENEKRIETFDIANYLKRQDYPIASALSALEITNEIQKLYFEQEDASVSFNVMKLYALLQSLFVSVDSLYALSYSITKSKSFININKNQSLRELKYIRNDVVGHPATRTLSSDTLAYCILDSKQVSKFTFLYHIYSGQGVEEKSVDLKELVSAYYRESNQFLEVLYQMAKEDLETEELIAIIRTALDLFEMNGDYFPKLIELKTAYQERYPNAASAQHRVLWRLEIIDQLLQFEHESTDVMDLAKHCIGLEMIKIYQLLTHQEYPASLQKRNPYFVTSFFRFLNKNKDLVDLTRYIYDLKNPLFMPSLMELLSAAREQNVKGPIAYLSLLETLYQQSADELLYALALPIKGYQQK